MLPFNLLSLDSQPSPVFHIWIFNFQYLKIIRDAVIKLNVWNIHFKIISTLKSIIRQRVPLPSGIKTEGDSDIF